jgi:hypothetical protein
MDVDGPKAASESRACGERVLGGNVLQDGLQRGVVLNRGRGRRVVLMFVCERKCRLL